MKKFPEGISIDIGFSCNNNCVFCVNNNKSRNFDLPTADVKKMIKDVKKFYDGVIFNGGEPTLREDLVQLIEFARKIGFKAVMMITNGRMLSYDNLSKDLSNAGLSAAFVTLQASSSELHDKQTSVEGSYDQTIRGIENLKKYKVNIHTNTVINKLNYKDLPLLPNLLSKLGVNFSKISFIRIKGQAEIKKRLTVIRMSKVVPYVKITAENFIKLKKNFIIQEIPFCVLKCYNQFIRKGRKMPLMNKNERGVKDFMRKYFRGGNSKSIGCARCIYFQECIGPWEEYTNLFGWNEFSPILKYN